MDAKKVRRHGFSLPLHTYQVISWIFTFLTISAMSIILAVSPEHYKFTIVYYILQTVTILLAFKTTITDPSDRLSIGKEVDQGMPTVGYCSLCQTNVFPMSKHCGSCNRCVQKFDHHCKMLNNCIGELNYKHFFALISAVMILEIFVGIYSGIFAAFFFRQEKNGIAGVCCFLIFKSLAVCIAIGYLILLHLYFSWKGITTYEYIILQKKKKEAEVIKDSSKMMNQTVPTLFSLDHSNLS